MLQPPKHLSWHQQLEIEILLCCVVAYFVPIIERLENCSPLHEGKLFSRSTDKIILSRLLLDVVAGCNLRCRQMGPVFSDCQINGQVKLIPRHGPQPSDIQLSLCPINKKIFIESAYLRVVSECQKPHNNKIMTTSLASVLASSLDFSSSANP